MEDWQPIDGKGAYGNQIRETLLIERQWDRILNLTSNNVLDYENRNKLKSALLGQLYFIKDRYRNRKDDIDQMIESIMCGERGTPQDEVKKCYMLIGAMRLMLKKSGLNEPTIFRYDDKENSPENVENER